MFFVPSQLWQGKGFIGVTLGLAMGMIIVAEKSSHGQTPQLEILRYDLETQEVFSPLPLQSSPPKTPPTTAEQKVPTQTVQTIPAASEPLPPSQSPEIVPAPTAETPVPTTHPATRATPTVSPVQITPTAPTTGDNASPPAQPVVTTNVLYVNPNSGDDQNGNGSERSPWLTLTHALSQVQPQQIIQLAPGTYSAETGEQFPLQVPAGVSLQGNPHLQGQNYVIQGGGAFTSAIAPEPQYATLVTLGNCRISGLTLVHRHPQGVGIWIASGQPEILYNTFLRNGKAGVLAQGNVQGVIGRNRFLHNGSHGLLAQGHANLSVQDNFITQSGFGVQGSEQAQLTLVGNHIESNRIGVQVNDLAQAHLRRNLVTRSIEYGLVSLDQSQVDLGTAAQPGQNIFRQNRRLALHNLTRSEIISAIGNQVEGQTQGSFIFEAPTQANQGTNGTTQASPTTLPTLGPAAIAPPLTSPQATSVPPVPAIPQTPAPSSEVIAPPLPTTQPSTPVPNVSEPPAARTVPAPSVATQPSPATQPIPEATPPTIQPLAAPSATPSVNPTPVPTTASNPVSEPGTEAEVAVPKPTPRAITPGPQVPDALVSVPATSQTSAPADTATNVIPADPNASSDPSPLSRILTLDPQPLPSPNPSPNSSDPDLPAPVPTAPTSLGPPPESQNPTGAAAATTSENPVTPESVQPTVSNSKPSTSGKQYRVLVDANSETEKESVKSLYPDAFSKKYEGRSVLQIGVFSTQENAEQALQSLKEIGLSGVLLPSG